MAIRLRNEVKFLHAWQDFTGCIVENREQR
jgi:hypothetical protein